MKNLEKVKEKLSQGENPMKLGYKPTNLSNGFYYIRKLNARIVVKLDQTTGNSDIVAFGLRSNEKNMEKFATVVNSEFETLVRGYNTSMDERKQRFLEPIYPFIIANTRTIV